LSPERGAKPLSASPLKERGIKGDRLLNNLLFDTPANFLVPLNLAPAWVRTHA